MERDIKSAQLKVRLLHLIIDGDNETVSGEDSELVESVSTTLDVTTVTLKGRAAAKGDRSLQVVGLVPTGATAQNYTFTSSNSKALNFTTADTGVHGVFSVCILVNDSRHKYSI